MTSAIPSCYHCTRFDLAKLTCEAFPERVPREILLGQHDHKTPFAGDGGLQFNPKPGYKPLEDEDDTTGSS